MSVEVLVLYDSRGLIEQLASAVGQGAQSVPGARARLVTIDNARREDMLSADAIILGSPNWSGMTGKMKHWLRTLRGVWEEGQLANKIGAAFTAGLSKSSGTEATLLQLIHWLLANGMVIVGLPWNDTMQRTGSYYGATAAGKVQDEDLEQARTLGRRVATLSIRMKGQDGRKA